jgi:phosphatidylserine/phosphatidylglycerophosphate/cardiolipin synthase-like enzyme
VLEPGRNCWRVEQTGRASFIVDAADYYRWALEAMLEAKSQIFIIGWDVDTRIKLIDEEPPQGAPGHLGPFLSWIAKRRPELEIYILVWDEGLLKVPGRGTTMFRMLRWGFDKQINVKFDSIHPLDASHHQKILVIDDALAFCGGIDIAADRWDTRKHRDEERGRKRPFTRRRYDPWHDATMAVEGDAARALGDLARVRWEIATGKKVAAPPSGSEPWPERLKPTFRDVPIAIARTRGKEGHLEEIREIEALFADMIACAKRFVYVETQYFASRIIAEAIGKRLEEPDPPEFVVVNPKHAYGWLDGSVMSPARFELMKALEKKDKKDRFRIYTPVTEAGADIYVHAKLLFVDDVFMRVGSANMNNRSMGLDSECDLTVDGSRDEETRRTIARLRTDMLAEHLGKDPAEVDECFERTDSLIGCIEALRGEGRTLVPFRPEEPTKLEKKLAKSEVLDPEGADQLFEPRARPGLLKGLHWRRGRRGRRG